jgi:multidrug efflux pump subunit AcrB
VAEIEAVQSTSSQGSSVVVVEFDLDADTEEAERPTSSLRSTV